MFKLVVFWSFAGGEFLDAIIASVDKISPYMIYQIWRRFNLKVKKSAVEIRSENPPHFCLK